MDQAEFEQLSDEEQEAYEKQLSGGDRGLDYPTPPSKDSIFKFFREILATSDSSKVGNLSERELGMLPHSTRRYIDLANYAEAEDLDTISAFFMAKAETILATSSSKKGFLPQLFVTQIKKEQKISPSVGKGSFWKNLGGGSRE